MNHLHRQARQRWCRRAVKSSATSRCPSFPGAKIGLLGLNGSANPPCCASWRAWTKDFVGEARPQPGIKVGYLEQEPRLDPENRTRERRGNLGEIFTAQAELEPRSMRPMPIRR